MRRASWMVALACAVWVDVMCTCSQDVRGQEAQDRALSVHVCLSEVGGVGRAAERPECRVCSTRWTSRKGVSGPMRPRRGFTVLARDLN